MKYTTLPFTAFVLAGGLGTRLKAVLSNCPKPMAPVDDKPFLEILIESLFQKGLRNIVLLTGYMADVIEEHFQSVSPFSIKFSREPIPLGTGGAVKNAEVLATDPTLLVNGDTFFDADLEGLFNWHTKMRVAATLSLVEVENTSRFGSVSLHPNGLVEGFQEKDTRNERRGFINAGFTLLSLETIKCLPAQHQFSMEHEIFPLLAQSHQMTGFVQQGSFFDIGTPDSYEQFKSYYRAQRNSS
jgi:NDP-sugar pyrophosphorylase family protein